MSTKNKIIDVAYPDRGAGNDPEAFEYTLHLSPIPYICMG